MSQSFVNRNESEVEVRAGTPTDPSPFAAKARLAFKAMVGLFAISILVQVFLAGLALFWDSARWTSHTGFAKILIVESVLILVISFISRMPLSIRMRSAALFVIIVLIAACAKLPSDIGYLSALHPVLAVMLYYGTVSLLRSTGALKKD